MKNTKPLVLSILAFFIFGIFSCSDLIKEERDDTYNCLGIWEVEQPELVNHRFHLYQNGQDFLVTRIINDSSGAIVFDVKKQSDKYICGSDPDGTEYYFEIDKNKNLIFFDSRRGDLTGFGYKSRRIK